MNEPSKELRLAVLIDADNVPYANIKGILTEVARYGTPMIKRIYGDWTKPNLSGWKPVLLEHAITPVQQYGYTSGKNATDSAMIIDAMDILYGNTVEGFCIISSDSDFTRLAIRIREAGKRVIGMGESKTPNPFIVACDKFVYIEVIDKDELKKSNNSKIKFTGEVKEKLIKSLSEAIDDVADEEGWAFLGDVGNHLIKNNPDFDSRNYGFMKLTHLVKSLKNGFEIDERKYPNNNTRHVYIRNKVA
ncbi:MAG: NYN domain-containing protein [Erysipelotrichia bacterium]|nr:NYN domain-containing protein [Erysipelotrichia bacterium]